MLDSSFDGRTATIPASVSSWGRDVILHKKKVKN